MRPGPGPRMRGPAGRHMCRPDQLIYSAAARAAALVTGAWQAKCSHT